MMSCTFCGLITVLKVSKKNIIFSKSGDSTIKIYKPEQHKVYSLALDDSPTILKQDDSIQPFIDGCLNAKTESGDYANTEWRVLNELDIKDLFETITNNEIIFKQDNAAYAVIRRTMFFDKTESEAILFACLSGKETAQKEMKDFAENEAENYGGSLYYSDNEIVKINIEDYAHSIRTVAYEHYYITKIDIKG